MAQPINHITAWLNHKGRIVDIRKKNHLIHEKVLIKEVDTKKPALFLETKEGRELTVLLGMDTTIELYPPETIFRRV